MKELKRREELEKCFLRRKSNERLERKVLGMVWRAMRLCRTLDERAGCPPTFVNGLWAPLFEQEVLRTNRALPEGWVYRWDDRIEPPRRIYRNVVTGEESERHPNPNVESMLDKARKAEETNKFRFVQEPRLFLQEIVEYLREDHDYFDMDEDLKELEEEEKARDGNNDNEGRTKAYDY